MLTFSLGALGFLRLGLLIFLPLGLLSVIGVLLGATILALLRVDGLADLEGRVLQSFESLLDLVGVLADDGLIKSGDVTLDLVLNVLRDTGGVLLQLLLRVVDVLVSLVLLVDNLLGGLVGLLGSFRFLHHAVDIHIGETTAGSNRDLLGFAGRFIFSANVHNTVGIDVEGDLDLGDTAGSHWDSLQVKVTELLVVLGELALTLENGDADLSLVISGSGESLALLGGNGRVSVDQSGEDATHGLNTQGEGSNVQQEDILDITGQDGTLDSGANSDSLVRVNTTVGRLVEEALNGFTDLGDTAGAANH